MKNTISDIQGGSSTKKPRQEQAGLEGQFNQYGVEQGYGAQYGQPMTGLYSNRMAWVPLKDRMVSIPAEMLEKMEINLTKVVQRTQDNNMTVALSVLQSAVFAFLQFERAFKSLFSKGDDNTQLHNLQKCIKELQQANASQKEVSTHEFSWLVTDEDPSVTNARELFEHCIKVIDEFIPLLGGRAVDTYSHEKVRQFAGWSGWQQQGEQIRVSNLALERLLQKFSVEQKDNVVYQEIRCFQQSVAYVLSCFSESKYPNKQNIEEIYAKNDIQFITTGSSLSINLNVNRDQEMNNLDDRVQHNSGGGGGLFGCFRGNSTDF